VNAVVDLAVEARFLAIVRHPNIIKMRAMEARDPFHSDYFIVLDKLYDIMPQRLKKWKSKKKSVLKVLDVKGKKKQEFWVERLTVAYDIACALSYLHGLSILYRDLKPDNIGFDVRGDVKIFDFGLAKEIDESKVLEDGTYHLTGDTGSLRYMAPEGGYFSFHRLMDMICYSYLESQLLWGRHITRQQIHTLSAFFVGSCLKLIHLSKATISPCFKSLSLREVNVQRSTTNGAKEYAHCLDLVLLIIHNVRACLMYVKVCGKK